MLSVLITGGGMENAVDASAGRADGRLVAQIADDGLHALALAVTVRHDIEAAHAAAGFAQAPDDGPPDIAGATGDQGRSCPTAPC